MLKITHLQKEAMGDMMLNSFVNRMACHLNTYFPDRCHAVEKQKLEEFIRASITKASTYNIVNECDVAKFIDLMVALSANFDSDPYVHEILSDLELAAETKLNLVYLKLLIYSKEQTNWPA